VVEGVLGDDGAMLAGVTHQLDHSLDAQPMLLLLLLPLRWDDDK
jgi:hypothetical protein